MKKQIFQKIELSNGKTAVIYEGFGVDFFIAMGISKGDPSLLIKHLLIQLAEINGEETTAEDLDKLPIRDISYMSKIISLMMEESYQI